MSARRRWPGGRTAGCGQTASRSPTSADLTERILSRGERPGWREPGDPLLGQPPERLRQIAARSAAAGEALERVGVGVRVDSSGLGVAETADAVLATGVWPAAGTR